MELALYVLVGVLVVFGSALVLYMNTDFYQGESPEERDE